jgi:hypothetical protein
VTRRQAAQLAIRVVVLGGIAAVFGGLSSYVMQTSEALPASPEAAVQAPDQQVSNRAAKTDRLLPPIPAQLAAAESKPYTLAAVTSLPEIDVAPGAPDPTTADPPQAVQAAAPLPPRKAKLPPPPPAAAPHTFLDDEQIAGLRTRLQLTADQAEYWPAVEAALREVVRTQLRGNRKHVQNGKTMIDVNSPEVQNLLYAAMPLIFRLREDQKREVRKLARVIGLESVASQI